MHRISKIGLVLGLAVFSSVAGCSSEQPSNMMENVDKQALADYEKMIAEDEQRMSAEAPDKDTE